MPIRVGVCLALGCALGGVALARQQAGGINPPPHDLSVPESGTTVRNQRDHGATMGSRKASAFRA